MKKLLLKTLALACLAATANAYAVTDIAGDFLAGYTGSHNDAFDVLSADVGYNAATNEFVFRTTAAGAIAGVAGAAYVFGPRRRRVDQRAVRLGRIARRHLQHHRHAAR